MQIKNFILPAALVAGASAKNLSEVIAANANLTTLSFLLDANPAIKLELDSYRNITFLAPQNEALNVFVSDLGGAAVVDNPTDLAQFLSYHILNGTHRQNEIGVEETVYQSFLSNSSYTNITAGQAVTAKRYSYGAEFISGLLIPSRILHADLDFEHGTLHVIDQTLFIPPSISTTFKSVSDQGFSSAVATAGLGQTLDDLHDVTIFVPNNDAFTALASSLVNDNVANLIDILEHHVVPGTVAYSTELTNTTVTTLQGGNLTITVGHGGVQVNGAKVVTPNLLVSGGVIHIIDCVLFP